MNYPILFFYVFSAVLIFSAVRVVTAKNPVHAVLFLMLAFSQASALWLLLKAEFLALTLVLVYLGAVMVLFLFVVMMLDIKLEAVRAGIKTHGLTGLLIGGVVAAELVSFMWVHFQAIQPVDMPQQVLASKSNAHALGQLLYTEYLYPIQAAAVILLIAMIAAIALTLRSRKDTKAINPALQVRVKASDRLRVVQVAVEQKPNPSAPTLTEGN